MALKRLFATYQRTAEDKGREFALTPEEFYALISSSCRYCGIAPSTRHPLVLTSGQPYPGEPLLYNGIDRVDNGQGYVLDNCVPSCETCNKAKRKMEVGEFLAWAEQAYQHMFGGRAEE